MDIQEKVAYCLSCPKPRCENACPTKNHICSFIVLCKQGKEAEAASLLYQTNPFPEITSLVCDYARQCQGACIRGIKGSPVSIPEIEYHLSSHPWPYTKKESNGKKIACVGAGIANLSLAVFLLQEGFDVEIFEKEGSLGGAILTGIPNFRLDKTCLSKIYEKMIGLGAVFHFGKEIRKEELPALKNDFDEVVLGIGAEKENLAGQKLSDDVVSGLELLRDLNVEGATPKYEAHKKAYVWGGGNVALDCARSLKRILPDTFILYRRSEKEMPGNGKEIAEAKEEGVKLTLRTNLKELHYDKNGKLCGGTFVKMGLGEPDESGRASFYEIEGSAYEEEFDLFVLAIGEKPDSAYLENNDCLIVGDAHYGAKNVASAITDGRDVAYQIIEKYKN